MLCRIYEGLLAKSRVKCQQSEAYLSSFLHFADVGSKSPLFETVSNDAQQLPAEVIGPGGVETSVLQISIFSENAEIVFSLDTPGMRIFKLSLTYSTLQWM